MAYSTTGVYVLVPITFTAAGEPQSLSYVALRDAEGRVYVTGTGRNPFSIGTAQPGIPRHTQAAVELPVDAAAGAEVVIALQANDEDHRRDDVAVIDLGISAADAEAWAGDDAAVEVEPLVEGEPNEDWT